MPVAQPKTANMEAIATIMKKYMGSRWAFIPWPSSLWIIDRFLEKKDPDLAKSYRQELYHEMRGAK